MEAPPRAVMAWLSFLSAHATDCVFSVIDAVLRDDDVATGTCRMAPRPRLVSRSHEIIGCYGRGFIFPIECYE